MKVADLAEELGVPASEVLAQCQRFGIDASWAGAELGGADVVVLRSEIAANGPIDLTPADPVVDPAVEADAEAEAVGSGAAAGTKLAARPVDGVEAPADPGTAAPAGNLPPTAVGSLPELIDEVTPEAAPVDAPAAAAPSGPGFSRAATVPTVPGQGQVAARREPAPIEPRFDRTIRSGLFALIVAVIAYVASNFVDLPVLVAVLWLVTAISLVVSVVDSFRGRRHATTHPERYRHTWVAVVTLVFAVAGIIGLTASVLAVTADTPDDAPAGFSDLASVQTARWGYQRVTRLADNGWNQPTREEGTCWSSDRKADPRDEQRVEAAEVNVNDSCTQEHTLEVARVFAYNREADAPYPGPDSFFFAGQEACGDLLAKAQEKDAKASLEIEYPDASGWSDGDHDVACVLVTPARSGRLIST